MAEAARHDEQFWQQAYRDHGGVVLGYLRRRAAGVAEAEDLLQETFLRAMDADSFRTGNLRGYLLTIARNLLISRIRRPRLVVSSTTGDEDTPDLEPVNDDSPERNAAWSAFRARLDELLDTMGPDQRSTFELGVFEQRPYSEIARMTGTNLSTVKVRIYRARRKIMDALGADLRELREMQP